MLSTNVKRDQVLAFCRSDADALLAQAKKIVSLPADAVPAEYLEIIAEEVLGYRLVTKPLSDKLLGHTLFEQRLIEINSRLEALTREGTDLRGLRNSTLAHEVGHIRLGHEGEMRRDIDTMTLSLFPEAPTPIVIQCYRKSYEPREMGWRHRQRERHANQWAACFLLPGEMLRQHEIVQELCEARDAHRDYSKKMLWNRIYRLAEHFQVSGSFVKTRLSELGYMTEEGGELALSHLLT